MKPIRLAHYGLSATLAASGLLIFAPAASAQMPACDPQTDGPILELVDGWLMAAESNDGLDCISRPSFDDDSGEDGNDSRVADEAEQDNSPTTQSPNLSSSGDEVAEESGDPLATNAQPPVSESNAPQAQESDNAQRDSLAQALAEVLGVGNPQSLASAGGGATVAEPENFFTQLRNEFVSLLSAF